MLRKFREPVSGFTHLFGALLSIFGLVILLIYSIQNKNLWQIVTFSIFGASLILLYSASTIYHLSYASEKIIKFLRKIDHSMIYILIAGTYTPICLIALRGAWGWSLFSIVWSLALVGILQKLIWFNAPRWLSTLFYLLMGWLVVIAIFPLIKVMPIAGFLWLLAGGIFYSIGAVIYALKWPHITTKNFGFHEIFHLFVLAGSFCHYWLMVRYIIHL